MRTWAGSIWVTSWDEIYFFVFPCFMSISFTKNHPFWTKKDTYQSKLKNWRFINNIYIIFIATWKWARKSITSKWRLKIGHWLWFFQWCFWQFRFSNLFSSLIPNINHIKDNNRFTSIYRPRASQTKERRHLSKFKKDGQKI